LDQLDNAASAYQSAIKLAEESLDNLKNEDERVAWLRSTDEVYRGMVRVLLAQKKDKQALEAWEWYESRIIQYKKHGGPNSPVQPLPDSTQNRLVYASFPDGIQIWLVKGNSIHSKWAAIERGEFEHAARSFSEKCANADADLKEIRQEGARLYALILQPVIEQLVDSDVVVVELDRAVYNLPVEALVSPDGHYFGEKYSVTYSPGFWEEESLRPQQVIVPEERVLLVDASRSPQSGYLPGMEAERKSIVGLFPRTKVVDSSATNVPDFQAQLATSEVFHFMGHGKQDGSGTHLVLSDKLTLGAKDFTPEFLQRSRLVVLSACSTGRGEKDGYLDTDSLVHSFLRAGVPSIVSSHWNVDSASSSRLMSSFYGHLITDKSVARAMYNARREMLGMNSHPYYWAGFSVVGRAT
jgi:CHAT domain-containing protein